MDAKRVLEEIDTCLQDAMQNGLGEHGLIFPFDTNHIPDKTLQSICNRLSTLFDMMNESYQYSNQLAQGNLKARASRTNIFAMPLKGLQANLMHLSWQADQVAKGDLNQTVHFLGDFSDSFNSMIRSIREKRIIEQQFQLITDVVGEGIFLVDPEGRILFSNPEASRILGYRNEEMENVSIQEVIHKQRANGTFLKPGENALYNAIASGKSYSEEGAFTCKSGLLMPVMIASRPVFKEDIADGAVIAFRDITEQKKHMQSLEAINRLLEKQATTDTLTGIYNRIKLNKELAEEIARAKRYHSPLSFIIFDIDHFKRVNDTYGHSAGDNVLKSLTKLVASNIRKTDLFARWGGEEFVILAPGLSLEETKRLAEKLRCLIEEFDFHEPPNITVSFGITVFQENDTSTLMLNRADMALYQAKENGRNQVQYCQ